MKLYVGGYESSCNVHLNEEGQLIYECDGYKDLQSLIEENLSDESRDVECVEKETSRTSGNAQIKKIIEPSAADWEDFRNLLDTLKVWDWQKRYEPLAITMDGTHWSVSIEYEDCQIKSKGSNAYPNHLMPEIAHGYDSADWVKFREGVSKLVGGKAFW